METNCKHILVIIDHDDLLRKTVLETTHDLFLGGKAVLELETVKGYIVGDDDFWDRQYSVKL